MIDPDVRHDTLHAEVSDRTVRQFAGLCGLMFAAVAARNFFARGDTLRALWFAAAAATVVIAGLLRPGTIRPFFTAAMTMTTPIRIIVSNVLLAVVYYGVFTPLAVFFRIIGRDA